MELGQNSSKKKKKSSLLEKEVLGVSCPCVHLVADDDRLPCPGSRGAPISWMAPLTYWTFHFSPPTFALVRLGHCHLILLFHPSYPLPECSLPCCLPMLPVWTPLWPESLVSAVSPVASWSGCWCSKMRVIQVEQEAIVRRIWALAAEAGHRSHEGANAHSALVDWSWFYTYPPL